MWCWLPFDCDGIAPAHNAPNQHDTHDAGFADDFASVVTTKHRREQTLAMVFNLRAGIAQPRDLHLSCLVNPQDSSFGELKQIEPECRDVLIKLARPDSEALRRKVVKSSA